MKRQIDAMIADAALWEIIRPDPLGTVPASNLVTPLFGPLIVGFLALDFINSGFQHVHGETPILVLRFLRRNHDDTRWNVCDPNC